MTARTTLLAFLAWAVTLSGLTVPALGADEVAVRDVSGRYTVSGQTVDGDGLVRKISGIINIRQRGATFTSHSELKTTDPTTESIAAEVIGISEGTIEGDHLIGQGDLQLVSSEVPGISVGFGLAPVSVTSRLILSSFNAVIDRHGTIQLVAANLPGEGETDYRPTTTTLEGKRLPDENTQAE